MPAAGVRASRSRSPKPDASIRLRRLSRPRSSRTVHAPTIAGGSSVQDATRSPRRLGLGRTVSRSSGRHRSRHRRGNRSRDGSQPPAQDGYGEAPRDDRSWSDEHRYLETLASQVAAGGSIRVAHSMLSGDPEEMISRRAADIDADLIVITSHGRTGFSRTWFGSVADGLVRRFWRWC